MCYLGIGMTHATAISCRPDGEDTHYQASYHPEPKQSGFRHPKLRERTRDTTLAPIWM